MMEPLEHLDEKHAANPLPNAPTIGIFCTGKI
jgi:hypothetical protein